MKGRIGSGVAAEIVIAPNVSTPGTFFKSRRLSGFMLSRTGLIITRIAIVTSLLLFWELASGTLIAPFWASSPSAVSAELWKWILDGSLWRNLQATLLAMMLGYVIGCGSGAGAGLILGFMPRLYETLAPYLSGLFALPKIALAPLFVLMLGIDIGSKVALVSITVFFLLLQSTLDGIRNIDKDVISALMLMGASKNEIRFKVMIPGALSWIFAGMRLAVRYALTGAILGEIIASNRGMGYLIEANAGEYNSTGVFAAVTALVGFCVLITEGLAQLERRLVK